MRIRWCSPPHTGSARHPAGAGPCANSSTPSCARAPMLFRIFTLLAVVALVVSTWILSSPLKRPQPVSNAAKADLPGYYLKNTVLTDYDETGAPTVRIEAERIDQIAHTPEVVLNNVRVNYLSQNGQNWVMFGDVAHVQPGGKAVNVTGNVRLQGESADHSPGAVV